MLKAYTMVLFFFFSYCNSQAVYSNLDRFEKEIQNFEARDKKYFPPPGSIVFLGSSSIRGWHETLEEDFSPLTIIPRGFGGSNMKEAIHYSSRILIPYKPRAVVLYEGDNDIAQGISAQKIADTFQEFIQNLHFHLPQTRVYFLSIKPSILRFPLWKEAKEANRLIQEICSKSEYLTYVDVASSMLEENGNPKKELFLTDNLHITRDAYKLWASILKPILIERELKWE